MTSSSKTNVKVVFGTMTFGNEGAEQSRVHDLKDCQKILDIFQSHGHDELDTARMYGNGSSEEFLNKLGVVDGSKGFKVATKVFPSARGAGARGWKPYDHTDAGVKDALNDSLKALGTNAVDLYYLHAPDREVPLEETLKSINDVYQEGHFKRFGISNYRADEVEQIMSICESKGYIKPTVYQGLYNSIARSAEAELLPVLRKHGLSYYCYNPLGGGFFTGAIKSKDDKVTEGRFSEGTWQGQSYRKRYYRDEYFEALDKVRKASSDSGLTMGEIALRWMQHHSKLDTKQHGDAIIIGASSINHIDQNLTDFEKGPLPKEVVDAVNGAWELCKNNAPPYHF